MSNPSKKKGTEGETKVVKFLNSRGIQAERRALSGSKDMGDIKMMWRGFDEFTLEVKTGKQTANPSRSQIEEWLRQAIEEGNNAGCRSALVVLRFRRSVEDAEVYITDQFGRRFMYLDEFAEWSA